MSSHEPTYGCPVHNTILKKEIHYGMKVWYCEHCAVYYALQQESYINSSITISGKPIKLVDKLSAIVNETDNVAVKQEEEKQIHFKEWYSKLTKSTERLICPIHRRLLDARVTNLQMDEKQSTWVTIGYCNKCASLYTNDTSIAFAGEMSLKGQPLTWSPFKLPPKSRVKSNMAITPNITVKTRVLELNIIKSKASIQIVHPALIANAKGAVLLKDGSVREIDGYYVASSKKFYTTPTYLCKSILPEECREVVINDSKGRLRLYQQSKDGQDCITKLRKFREDERWCEQLTMPKKNGRPAPEEIDYFTQPLLKGDNTVCPFCRNKLTKNNRINMVAYKDGAAVGRFMSPSLFCEACQVPFISLEQEIAAIKRLSPKKIYVFDARSCESKEDLMARATERLATRPIKAVKASVFPYDNELEEGAPIPNISYTLRDSTVLVYANNCHCEACRNKYRQNTIRDRAALVQTVAGKAIKINVQFCVGCGRYFMNITSFRQYCKMHGAILIECSMDKSIVSTNASWLNFAPDSILSRCGYSVKEGVPRTHRQAILAYILDSGKAKKYEILELISGFIHFRQDRYPAACSRWREDILFVNEYKIQSQEVVEGLSFRKVGSYKDKEWR